MFSQPHLNKSIFYIQAEQKTRSPKSFQTDNMEVYSNDNRVKSLEKEVIMLKSAIFDIQQGK